LASEEEMRTAASAVYGLLAAFKYLAFYDIRMDVLNIYIKWNYPGNHDGPHFLYLEKLGCAVF
jgi:hypothetical protein